MQREWVVTFRPFGKQQATWHIAVVAPSETIAIHRAALLVPPAARIVSDDVVCVLLG